MADVWCVRFGANVNHVDADDWTPLLHATKGANFEVAQILLNHGADAEYGFEVRKTVSALELAKEFGQTELSALISSCIENKMLDKGIIAGRDDSFSILSF